MTSSKLPTEKLPSEVSDERVGEPPEDPRVHLAAERTLLAWIRTGLAMMGFGFVVARSGHFVQQLLALQDDSSPTPAWGLSFWIGGGLILLGIVSMVLAGMEHWRFMGTQPQLRSMGKTRLVLGLGIALSMGILGILMIGYLATL